MKKFNNGEGAILCDTCHTMLMSGNHRLKAYIEYQDGKTFCNTRECDKGVHWVGSKVREL